jgi:hypothetical protein
VVIRANGSGYSYSRTQGLSSNSFAIDTSLLSFGLIADLHPFSSGFRISGGVRYHDMHLAGSITPDVATVTINGVSYPIAVIGTLHADVTGNKIAPYLGLGFDSSHFYPSNFSLSFDVGAVYFGNPKVVLSTDGTAPGLEANLRAEEEKVQDALKFLQFYPVAMLTAKFVF